MEVLQLPDRINNIGHVSPEPRNALHIDQINLPVPAVLHHALKLISSLYLCSAASKITIESGQCKSRVILDLLFIGFHLNIKGVFL